MNKFDVENNTCRVQRTHRKLFPLMAHVISPFPIFLGTILQLLPDISTSSSIFNRNHIYAVVPYIILLHADNTIKNHSNSFPSLNFSENT